MAEEQHELEEWADEGRTVSSSSVSMGELDKVVYGKLAPPATSTFDVQISKNDAHRYSKLAGWLGSIRNPDPAKAGKQPA